MQLRHRREWQGVRAEVAALMQERQKIRKSRTDLKDERKELTRRIRAIEEDYRARCEREIRALKGPGADAHPTKPAERPVQEDSESV